MVLNGTPLEHYVTPLFKVPNKFKVTNNFIPSWKWLIKATLKPKPNDQAKTWKITSRILCKLHLWLLKLITIICPQKQNSRLLNNSIKTHYKSKIKASGNTWNNCTFWFSIHTSVFWSDSLQTLETFIWRGTFWISEALNHKC